MLNKFMKQGNRKVTKSDGSESAVYAYGTAGGAPIVSASNVTVNHASRTTLSSSIPRGAASALANSHPQASSGTAVPQMEALPLFCDVPVPDRQALFLRKLQIYTIIFDFSDTLKSAREKETKRQMLLELVDFIQSDFGCIVEPVQEELVRTVGINIFRCLPPASHENTGSESTEPKEEDTYLEPAWPHLQLVYNLLLRYIVSSDTDTKIAKRYIDHSFILRLLDLFNSEDPCECEYCWIRIRIR